MASTKHSMVGYFCEGGLMSWEWCPGGAGIAGTRFGSEDGFAMIRRRSGLQEASLLTSAKLLKTCYYAYIASQPVRAPGRGPRKSKALLQSALLKYPSFISMRPKQIAQICSDRQLIEKHAEEEF